MLFLHISSPSQWKEWMSNCDSSDTSEGSGFLRIFLSWCWSHHSLFFISVPKSHKQAHFTWTTCIWLCTFWVFVLFLYGKAEWNKGILDPKLNVVVYLTGVAGTLPFQLITFWINGWGGVATVQGVQWRHWLRIHHEKKSRGRCQEVVPRGPADWGEEAAKAKCISHRVSLGQSSTLRA